VRGDSGTQKKKKRNLDKKRAFGPKQSGIAKKKQAKPNIASGRQGKESLLRGPERGGIVTVGGEND